MRKLQRHSQTEMFGHIEKWIQINLSQRAYTIQNGIACSALLYWLKKFSKIHKANSSAEVPSGFIPVMVQQDTEVNKLYDPSQLHFLMSNGIQYVCPETIHPLIFTLLQTSGKRNI